MSRADAEAHIAALHSRFDSARGAANERRAALTARFARVKLPAANPEADAAERARWYAVFARWGVEYVYECIANNLHIPTIAEHHGAPVALLGEWCKDNLDPARMRTARKLAAASVAQDSLLVLENASDRVSHNPQALAKLAADHARMLMLHAERQDNDLWGPPMPSLPEQGRVQILLALDGRSVPADMIQEVADKRQRKLASAPQVFDPRSDADREADAEYEYAPAGEGAS